MMAFGITLLLIAACAVFYFMRVHERIPSSRKLKQSPAKPLQRKKSFHAVRILCADEACEIARNDAGLKYLSSEAPSLPLEGCRAPICTCRYEHFEDRRDDDDRRSLFGNRNSLASFNEKRQGAGRRESKGERQNYY